MEVSISGISDIGLLVLKLKCAAYPITPASWECQGRDNLFSQELTRLVGPVYFVLAFDIDMFSRGSSSISHSSRYVM